jgi:hypothetical protein
MRFRHVKAGRVAAMTIVTIDSFLPMDVFRELFGGDMKPLGLTFPQFSCAVAGRARVPFNRQLRASLGLSGRISCS